MLHQVTSLDSPELRPYRTLRRPAEHLTEGLFIAEGAKVVERLLRSELAVVSALMTERWHDELLTAHPRLHDRIPEIYLAAKGLVESIVGFPLHQGIMAVGRVPAERTIEEVVEGKRGRLLLVALDGLVNAENVGMAVRNCAAFGVDAVLSGETSSSPFLRRSVRNSMGTVFTLPILHPLSLAETLRLLARRHAVRIIAAHPNERSSLYEADLTGDVCLVMGNEGDGISAPILDACTERLAIPMLNKTDSLNVASASAVFLYEAARQRQKSR
jgi:tRNA G18 (ribose-2'-O)-methylase SpoU